MNNLDDAIRSEPQGGNARANVAMRKIPLRRSIRPVLSILLLSLGSYLLLTHFVLMAIEIKGMSMSPTLLDGQRYLLYRCTYFWRAPHKGEIVVIKDPEDHGLSIKRIVGLPNDVVEMRRDGLYINGARENEPYLLSKYTLHAHNQPTRPIHLDSDHYFVLGDNRNRSADSRIYGPVERRAILGMISK